ncbi:acetyl-CoA hydrolase/transferase C-terminal domain-containing protein, partial [Phenylobacterium sp.]|uniref:acetyl-CoA hydrolase/transferase C-terminal domain-containing protein n=1 Tax=Phenylobacterium sp. TaxID=1871053 RepID=UPI002FDB95E8
ARPQTFTDPDAVALAIIERLDGKVVLGLPLGLGKANHIANALFARAAMDRAISLRIFSALTLTPPRLGSLLEKRFLGPILDRTLGGYPELAYAQALQRGELPPNIEVDEFFLQAGVWLSNPAVQQSYISANYTHAGGYILERGCNVVAQLVAKTPERSGSYSLSCNTDLTLELLRAKAEGRADILLAGQVNSELPYMPGGAEQPASAFDFMLEDEAVEFPLPGPPKQPVSLAHYAMGFHVASLIPDDGTLEIGIGSMGHAVAHALILRHRRPARFREILGALVPSEDRTPRHTEPFEVGLYGATEMFVDAFLELYRAGVLKREVDGAVLHAAFFLAPRDFYAALRTMSLEERARFQMTEVGFVNALYGADYEARVAARRNARFVNNGMIATLLGAITSDALEDGRVVSGVGGQYNFVAQAFALPDARSIMTLPSWRDSAEGPQSNIRWSYGHTTIPRHLRDMVVTEYGVADLRGAADAEVIARMLETADSRWHDMLMEAAKSAGKLPAGHRPSPFAAANHPDKLAQALAPFEAAGDLPPFPFGGEMTPLERDLAPVLQAIKTASRSPADLARLAGRGLGGRAHPKTRKALERLGLSKPRGLEERLSARLVRGALAGAE